MLFKLTVVLLCVILDQASKAWAVMNLKEQAGMTLIPGILEISYRENTGMAFSMFHDQPMFLTVFNSFIVALLLVWVFKQAKVNLGLLLIAAGGLGNLLDRFIHGYVIDFINPLFISFAVFNIADVALNIGVFLLLWEGLRGKQ